MQSGQRVEPDAFMYFSPMERFTMRMKPLIKKYMIPALREEGLSFEELSRANYCFSNPELTEIISIDTPSIGPRKMRVEYIASGAHSFRFQLSKVRPNFCKVGFRDYTTQEELEQYIKDITEETVRTILPYIRIMREQGVNETDEQCKALAENTQVRARRFAERWNLNCDKRNRQNRCRMDEIIAQWQTTLPHRREDFYTHEDEIIDMAAYLGWLMMKDPLNPDWENDWYWREIAPGHPEFTVRGYDPLCRTISAWNHGGEIYNCSLEAFPF